MRRVLARPPVLAVFPRKLHRCGLDDEVLKTVRSIGELRLDTIRKVSGSSTPQYFPQYLLTVGREVEELYL